jgi:fatty-acyl-CoA synthase
MRSTMMDIPLTITSIMRYGTSVYGDREVVTCTEDGTRRRTYAEAGRRAAQLANALRRLGVDADRRVGTFMWNNAEHLEAYMAVPSMGAVLHTLNIRLAPAEVGYIVTHAEDYAVIVDASLVSRFAEILPHTPTVKHVIVSGGPQPGAGELPGVRVHSYEELLAAEPASFDWPELDETSAAAMCYTSGTTGYPKGVVYSHRSSYLHSMGVCMGNVFGLSDRDRVLPVVPMFHANAWGLAYASLMSGAALVMPDRFMQPAVLIRLIGDERVTLAGGVPTIWAGVLAELQADGGDVSSLRLVVAGGSAVPHAMQARFESEHGVRMLQAWGMTETSPLASVASPPPGLTPEQEWHYRDSQGRVCNTVEARLAKDGGEILPSDGEAVGEIEVRGPWITGSYYQDDDQAKFHDGWLRTGDVGTLDEQGFIRLTDRAKDVIKSGGEWISSMALENILMAHPDVAEAAVIGIADEKWGERPLAAVVLRPGAEVTAEKLRAFLAEQIPRWQLPERWCFVAEVPKTSVGKFSKRAMREAYALGQYEVVEVR